MRLLMPGDLETRAAQVEAAVAAKLDSGTAWLLRRELKKLPRLLDDGETIVRMAQGKIGDATGLLVATDRRLMFVAEAIVRNTHESYPYTEITGIETQVDVVNSQLTVSAGDETAVISGIYPKDQAMEIADHVRNLT
jgi:PH (Pleckstrin Homology) domain-containing protein